MLKIHVETNAATKADRVKLLVSDYSGGGVDLKASTLELQFESGYHDCASTYNEVFMGWRTGLSWLKNEVDSRQERKALDAQTKVWCVRPCLHSSLQKSSSNVLTIVNHCITTSGNQYSGSRSGRRRT